MTLRKLAFILALFPVPSCPPPSVRPPLLLPTLRFPSPLRWRPGEPRCRVPDPSVRVFTQPPRNIKEKKPRRHVTRLAVPPCPGASPVAAGRREAKAALCLRVGIPRVCEFAVPGFGCSRSAFPWSPVGAAGSAGTGTASPRGLRPCGLTVRFDNKHRSEANS